MPRAVLRNKKTGLRRDPFSGCPSGRQACIFAALANDKNTPKDDEEKVKTATLIAKTIKALVSRDLWDTSQYFQIINDDDATIEKALQVIRK